MISHTSNCLFLIFYSAKKSLPFHHILVPLVEEEFVSIMSDESTESSSYSEVGYTRFPSYRMTHRKLPDIKSIWEFSGINLKG